MKRANFNPTTVLPEQRDWGYIDIIDRLSIKFDMPVIVINGGFDGPTFTVTAGLYPLEYCGVEAAGRIYQRIDPEKLKGKVIIIPIVNIPVFQFRTPMFALTQSLSPTDGKNINETFPGHQNGTATEVLAYKLFHEFIMGSDYHVDLRGGEITESHLAHTIFLQDAGKLNSILHTMGITFGLKYCLSSRKDISHTMPGTLVYEAVAKGIP